MASRGGRDRRRPPGAAAGNSRRPDEESRRRGRKRASRRRRNPLRTASACVWNVPSRPGGTTKVTQTTTSPIPAWTPTHREHARTPLRRCGLHIEPELEFGGAPVRRYVPLTCDTDLRVPEVRRLRTIANSVTDHEIQTRKQQPAEPQSSNHKCLGTIGEKEAPRYAAGRDRDAEDSCSGKESLKSPKGRSLPSLVLSILREFSARRTNRRHQQFARELVAPPP